MGQMGQQDIHSGQPVKFAKLILSPAIKMLKDNHYPRINNGFLPVTKHPCALDNI